ncbi:uncharacterized protein TNCV_4946101 [Trichonephila clavipes]|nr:uncharacterized protein TNCV_4946101 [Trichonephila clavipes]
MWYQHDGASAHKSAKPCTFLAQTFDTRIIGYGGQEVAEATGGVSDAGLKHPYDSQVAKNGHQSTKEVAKKMVTNPPKRSPKMMPTWIVSPNFHRLKHH